MTSGKRALGVRVVAFAAPGRGGVAFVAGRKMGKAVQRNRSRRVLRAAWAEVSAQVQEDFDIVLVARSAILGASSPDVAPEISELLRLAGAAG